MSPASPGTVPIAFIHRLLENADLLPDRKLALVRAAGIAPALLEEATARVTAVQFSDLFRLLARRLDDELPGMFSRPVPNGTLKLLCLSILDSPSVRVSLYRLTRFFRLIVDDLRIDLRTEAGQVRIALIPFTAPAAKNTFAQEMVLKLVHGVASWLVGRKLPLARVDFTYSRPAHVSDYVFLYPGPAYFNQLQTALYFELAQLDRPVRQDKRSLGEFLRRAPEDWLFVSFAERIVSHRVREYLAKHLSEPNHINAAADALLLSVRTLARRLQAEGTSFQLIKDELRRDMAIHRLSKSKQPIAQLAAELGFDDVTTFHRAFRKWTGSTPGAYRFEG